MATQQTPMGLVIAQTIGITASLFVLGGNVGLSVVSVPAVMLAPAPLAAKQWYDVYMRSGAIARPLAILSAVATAYVAYHQDPSSTPFKLNMAATILLPSIVPFTLVFIAPTNNKLLAKKDQLASASLDDKAIEAGVAQGETVNALLDRWAMLNLARAALVGAGALCAVLAALNKREVVGFNTVRLASGANRMG